MIKTIDKTKTIERYLKKTGQQVTIVKGSESTTLFAVIEQTWKRNKTRFEENSSKIGRYYNDYYIYFGPASYDISALAYDDYALIGGEKYAFIQSEKVTVDNRVQYYRGVLKKLREADGNVFV